MGSWILRLASACSPPYSLTLAYGSSTWEDTMIPGTRYRNARMNVEKVLEDLVPEAQLDPRS